MWNLNLSVCGGVRGCVCVDHESRKGMEMEKNCIMEFILHENRSRDHLDEVGEQ